MGFDWEGLITGTLLMIGFCLFPITTVAMWLSGEPGGALIFGLFTLGACKIPIVVIGGTISDWRIDRDIARRKAAGEYGDFVSLPPEE